MQVNGFEVQGQSVSGFTTAVVLPEYNLCFDCGVAQFEAVKVQNVAVTHSHMDHFGGLTRHAYVRGMTGGTPSQFFLPEWLVDPTHKQMAFWSKVQNGPKPPYDVRRVKTGRRVALDAQVDNGDRKARGGERYLKSFKTDHRVPSQGYVLVEERKRLKPEYVGVEGRELGRLRREGVDFEETTEVPLVGFTGDTRARLFDTYKPEAKVHFVECTFLDDKVTEQEAERKGHVHLDALVRREAAFENVEALVLHHFSARYYNRDVERAIARMPQGLREKTTFLPLEN